MAEHHIEDVELRGRTVQIYYPQGLPFLTARVEDSDIEVFISFEAEFPYGWETKPWKWLLTRARHLALQRVQETIEERSRERRRQWHRRQMSRF